MEFHRGLTPKFYIENLWIRCKLSIEDNVIENLKIFEFRMMTYCKVADIGPECRNIRTTRMEDK